MAHTTRLPWRHLSHLFPKRIRLNKQKNLTQLLPNKNRNVITTLVKCVVSCACPSSSNERECPMCIRCVLSCSVLCVCCEKTAQDNRLLVLFLLCQVVANRIFLVSLLCPVCLLCDVSVVVSYRCDNIWAKNNYNNKYNKIMIEVNGKTC